MPVNIKRLLSEHKLDSDSLKRYFDADTLEKRQDVKKFVDQIRDVIREGVWRNRRDYRLFKAMDWAYDSPFYQVSLTQLKGLISDQPDDKKVMESISSWGLTHLLPDVIKDGKPCCGPDGKKQKAISLPVFFNIFVPICMAYHTIRWAKLFNDRNLVPLYKYEPVQYTKENRLRCEVITQMVQRQSSWFGYSNDERQSIFQMLQYGYCINFPREAWFVEKQEDENGKEKIVREGLRFNMPHPARVYFDQYHRLSTLNSNSGCEYAGYWELLRYRDIYEHPLYWNKEKISIGAMSWFDFGVGGASDFLDQVFPCTFKWPDRSCGTGGAGQIDRESDAARYYMHGDFNCATLATQHFQKIIPKEKGLGTYEYPVWFRFIMASDNAVIWAEPLAFDRFPTYAYDADFNRSRFKSLTLEITPFQDHISNILTNWILAVKENLQNPIFYDKEKVPVNAITELENLGAKSYGHRVLIPYSSTENYRMRVDQREAFYPVPLTRHNVAELSQLINGVLSMLDRIMQYSPQELGQSAPHEQTAEENRIIAGNTSSRVSFTGTFVDEAIYAKKVAFYDANMAYADPEIIVGISSSWAATEEEFKKLIKSVGLEVTDDSAYDPETPDSMHMVKANKDSIKIEQFASNRDASERIDNPAIADAMSKIFLSIANNPVLIQSVGPVQLVELLNQIILTAGLPKEFRLRAKAVEMQPTPEEQGQQLETLMKGFAEQVQQAIAKSQQEAVQQSVQASTQIVKQAVTETTTPLAQGLAETNKQNELQQVEIEALGKAVAKLNELISAVSAASASLGPGPMPPPGPVPPGPMPPEMMPPPGPPPGPPPPRPLMPEFVGQS